MIDPYPCPKGDAGCGEMHTGCRGHNRAGRPCGAQPMLDTGDSPRCRSHLGKRPEVVRAAYRADRIARLRFEEAKRAAEAAGAAGIDPLAALVELAGEIWSWKQVCQSMVGSLEEVRYKNSSSGEQLRAEVALYERSMERAGRVLVDIARLGGEQWLTRLSSEQSDRVARAVIAAVDEVVEVLGIDTNAIDVRAIVSAHLREVSGP